MDVADAVLGVLTDADEPLHWTVIQDRALRSGAIDPFTTPDVRKAVLEALYRLKADGRVVAAAKGVYAIAPTYGR
jgi:hypothetical protein